MAAQIADRLTIQEEEIRWLSDEIGRLLELGMHGTVDSNPSPELEQLRTENEKLKYRIVHLQRCLKEEQDRGRAPDSPPPVDETQARPELKESPREKEITQQTGKEEQRPQATSEDKGESSVVEKQNKKRKEKKPSKAADEQKQEGSLTNGGEVGPERGPTPFSKSGPPDFLQLIHRREYWDTLHRPWKVIFPLKGVLNEPASTIILKRLEEIRKPVTQDQLENVKLPQWLEQHEELHFKSSDATWTVLFQDPSPDKYLLLLKSCRIPLTEK